MSPRHTPQENAEHHHLHLPQGAQTLDLLAADPSFKRSHPQFVSVARPGKLVVNPEWLQGPLAYRARRGDDPTWASQFTVRTRTSGWKKVAKEWRMLENPPTLPRPLMLTCWLVPHHGDACACPDHPCRVVWYSLVDLEAWWHQQAKKHHKLSGEGYRRAVSQRRPGHPIHNWDGTDARAFDLADYPDAVLATNVPLPRRNFQSTLL